MFQHILIPVDFSEKNAHAVRIAVEMTQHHHAKISLIHVIEVIADTTFDEFKTFYAPLEARARHKMDDLLSDHLENGMADKGIRFEERIVYGNRTQEIISFAEQHGVDLIVMSSHRVDPDEPTFGWGSISYKVGILAPCPILLVK